MNFLAKDKLTDSLAVNILSMTIHNNERLGVNTIQVNEVNEVKSVDSNISKIKSLSEINVSQPEKTLFLFDIDDTVFDSAHMIGTSGWRKYIGAAAGKIDSSRNWHDVFSHFLSQKHPLQTAEPNTSQYITNLQEKGYVVCGLTARERNKWYDTPQNGVDVMTTKQLNSVGVNFNNRSLEDNYPHLSWDSEYFSGTFFADTDTKGEYLIKLLKGTAEAPKKVVFIDDKKSQVESVSKALVELGIEHECYTYSALEDKPKSFNPLLANIQLYYFYQSNGETVISDSRAQEIAAENPEKDAEYYLRATLEIAKK